MGLIKIVGIAVLIAVALGLIAFEVQNFANNKGIENFNIGNYNPFINQPKVDAPGEIMQFIPNLRFRTADITYFFDSQCSESKKQKVLDAFKIISNETGIIKFTEDGEKDAGILIACSKTSYQQEKNIFIAGEGGPTNYLNLSTYPVITRGKIILYDESKCSQPITELHELLHVFGFDHVNDSGKIMYPYIECDQVLDTKVINDLIKVYSIPALPEIYFENVSAKKLGKYMDFYVEINNAGLNEARGVKLNVYADNKLTDTYNLETIGFGAGTTFKVQNLELPSSMITSIKFELTTPDSEYDKSNNIITLSV